MKLIILILCCFYFLHEAEAQVNKTWKKPITKNPHLQLPLNTPTLNIPKLKKDHSEIDNSVGKKISKLILGYANPAKAFHGNIRFTAQYCSQPYIYQPLPATYARWEFNPEFSLYGLPLTANIFWSTEQKQVSYQLNRMSFKFDSKKYQDQLAGKARQQMELDLPDANSLKARMQQNVIDKDQVASKLGEYEKKYNLSDFDKSKAKFESDSFPSVEKKLEFEQLVKAKNEYDSLARLSNELTKLNDKYSDLQEHGYFELANHQQVPYIKQPIDRKQLSKSYSLSSIQKIFLNINQLEVGPINPYYSPLYINGVSMKGVNLEAQPGKLYFAFVAGNAFQELSFRSINTQLAKSMLIGGRIGIGAKEATHFYVSFFSTGEKSGLAQFDSTLFLRDIKSNKVLLFSSRVNLVKNVYFEGEYATSFTEGMPEASIKKEIKRNNLLSLLNQPNAAWMVNLKGNLPRNDTRFSAQLQKTGTAFFTLGNPYLRRDLLRYNVKVEQKLYKQYIGISMNYRRDEDNLLPIKQYRTIVSSFSTAISLYIKKLPSLKVIYTPFYQTNQTEEVALKYQNRSRLLSTVLTYSKKVLKSNLTYSFNYTIQSIFTSTTAPVNLSYYTFSQLINFKSKIISDLSGSYISPGSSDSASAYILNTGISYKMSQKSMATLGGNYTADRRWGASWGISAKITCSLWKNNQLSFMAKKNFPDGAELYATNAKQFIASFQLTQSW